jgi:hypothetical protein
MRAVKSFLAEMEEEQEVPQKEGIKINLEKHKDVLYMYNAETNEFLGQSTDIYELDKILNERYPGKKFILSEKNLAEVGVEL